MEILWWLLAGHALGDFVLQTDSMARGKSRHRRPSTAEGAYFPPWAYWLAAHALIHGGIVALVTGSVALGVAETVAHTVIDFGKNERWYGFHADQALHIGCKLGWVALI